MNQARAEEVGDRTKGCTLCIVVGATGRDLAGYLGANSLELAKRHAEHLNSLAAKRLFDITNKLRRQAGRAKLPEPNIGRIWNIA